MPEHVALAVGVVDYLDEECEGLNPVIANDLAKIAGALQADGYKTTTIGLDGHLTKALLRRAVRLEAGRVSPSTTLMLFLSGHGVGVLHHHLALHDFSSKDPKSFKEATYSRASLEEDLEGSDAETILVFVDACREGVSLTTTHVKAADPGDAIDRLPNWLLESLKQRRVIWIFGCQRGNYCRYNDQPGGLSHFTEALAETLMNDPSATTLTLLHQRCQEQLDRIVGLYGHPRQVVSVEGLEHSSEHGVMHPDPVLDRVVRRVIGRGSGVVPPSPDTTNSEFQEIPLGAAGSARVRYPYIDFVDPAGVHQLTIGVDPTRVRPNQISEFIAQVLRTVQRG